MSWSGALTLGILVSITDPVETINRLNYKGASHKFTTLVELEAISNDGTGIIFFNFFAGMAVLEHAKSADLSYIYDIIIWAGLGGIILGVIFKNIC